MSAIVTVKNLSKNFKIPVHQRGTLGTIKNLLNRQYREIDAVNRVSFDIHKGELVGYLGPNGAGKSTTIKMLTGLLVPSSGSLRVINFVPWRDRKEYVSHIGVVFGQRTTLWWDLPVIESLDLLQYIYKISKKRFRNNLEEFTSLLDLSPFLDTPVRSLSLGQRMRADIAAALLHDPVILFLDEPTIGLDVVAKERIRQFILHINQARNTTVILTTHDLSDVEKLCERVIIIDHGHLLFDGKLETIKNRFGWKRELVVDLREHYSDVSIQEAQVISHKGLRVTYQFNRNSITASELIGIVSNQFRIRDLEVREPDIETTIRRIYEEKLLET